MATVEASEKALCAIDKDDGLAKLQKLKGPYSKFQDHAAKLFESADPSELKCCVIACAR